MPNKIFIYRFSSSGRTNMRAAEALKPFYAAYRMQAVICPTPFGMMTNMLSDSTAQEIFDALIAANIGDEFMVIEVGANDAPIVTLMTNGGITTGNNTTSIVDNVALDRNKSREQLMAELDALIEKVGENGVTSLTPNEKARLDHLSQL